MIKRILIIVLICFMLIDICIPINAFALDMTLDNNYIKGLIATTLVSAGLVFNTAESLNDTVENVKLKIIEGGLNNHFPKEPDDPDPNLNDIIRALFATAGTMIFNAADQTYQTLVNIPQWWWEFMTDFVNNNYDVGENYSDPNYSEQNEYFFNGYHVNIYERDIRHNAIVISFEINGKRNQNYFRSFSRSGSDNTEYISYSVLNVELISNQLNFTDNLKYKARRGEIWEAYDQDYTRIVTNPYITVEDPGITNPIPDILGINGIVDNENFDWNNNKTNDKTILLPVESDVTGNPIIDNNGVPQVNLDNNFMVNTQPSSIPQQNIDGSPYTPPDSTPIEDPSVFQGQNIGLLQGITNLLSQIGSFLFNLPNLLFDVPSDLTLNFDNLKLNGFQDRFPFSIPWDISAAIGVFSSSPSEPDLTIDMDTNYFTLNHEIDISAISLPLRFARYAASVFFVLYLANKTRDLIKW